MTAHIIVDETTLDAAKLALRAVGIDFKVEAGQENWTLQDRMEAAGVFAQVYSASQGRRYVKRPNGFWYKLSDGKLGVTGFAPEDFGPDYALEK